MWTILGRFELADLYTENINAASYAAFMLDTLKRITCTLSNGVVVWADDKEVSNHSFK